MKRIISLLLCITMLLLSANVVLADEVKEDVYNTVSVEFSDNIGNLEKLQVMVKDDNVYANAEELGTRLGYDVSVSDEYVSIYNKEADENVPYGLTVFYYDSTKVGHMLFTQMVDSYEAPFETIKNENGVWIPLEYSLLLLNSSSLVVGNTICIEMPSKNIIDIYMDISQNNQKYLFDWQDDIGISEKNESIMEGASFMVSLFNGLLKLDGESWLQGIQIMALDTSAYDAKYAEELAVLFCTYSDDELSKAVDDIKEKMSPFNGDNALSKAINKIDKELDKNIGDLLETSEDLKKQIDANNNASIVAYNKSYQALENACDKADFFSDATELYTKVGKGVAEATSFLEAFYNVAEVVGFANEFKNQDEFAVNALLEFVENSDSQSVMSNAMKEGISAYAGTLQTDIVAYSGLRWLEENYDKIIFDKMKLTSVLGLPANLILIGWDVVKENVPFYEEGLSDTDSFMLSMYASIFQADSFTSYQNLRNTTFDNVENITPENLYEVSQYCYTYLKSCYLTREAALASLSEENEKKIPSVIEYQNAINEEIAGYLVQLKNADTINKYGCYGFLPKDNVKYLKDYSHVTMLEVFENNKNIDINEYLDSYKSLVELLEMKQTESWQFGTNDSFEKDGYYLEYRDQMYSMKNTGNLNICFFGVSLGEKISDADIRLKEQGWVSYSQGNNSYTYLAIIDGSQYYLEITVGNQEEIISWYFNNWPEGDGIWEQFEKIENNSENIDREEWKRLYINYILDLCLEGDYSMYALICIDNDDVPELLVGHNSVADGEDILTVQNGKLEVVHIYSAGLSYLERENLFCDSGGRMDVYYDKIYAIQNGSIVELYHGEYGAKDNSNVQMDENGNILYDYYWEDVQVSETEYEENLSSVYNRKEAVSPYNDLRNVYDIIDMIKEY